MRVSTRGCVAVAAGMMAWPTVSCGQGLFERMQIERVIGGVDGDTSAQAIQLRMRSPGQNEVSWARLWAYDENGNNPILLVDLATDVAGGEIGDRVLVATARMKALTNPPLAPDFIMKPIPPAYLAAGRLTWECDCGIKYWSLASGGYLGSNSAAILNDDDGDFGPPYPGAFPTSGVEALEFLGGAEDLAVGNSLDYAPTQGAAVLTNNKGKSFTVTAPPDAPSGLSGAEYLKGVARLTWADNSPAETGFRVQRKQYVANKWVNLSTVSTEPADTTSYMESPGSGEWRYRVESVDGVVGSGYTPFVRIKPARPTGLGAQKSNGAALITWTDASEFEARYEVQRCKKANGVWGAPATVANLGANTTSFGDSPGAGTFRYRVRAANVAGASVYAGWATIVIP